jgi:hypothetical protein
MLKCSRTVASRSQVWPSVLTCIVFGDPPEFLDRRRDRLQCELLPPARKRTEGARGARGPDGPTGLDASRHRGLSKSLCRAASPPNPKASRARCLRFAPRRSPVVERLGALERLSTVEDQPCAPTPADKAPALSAVRALDATRCAGSCAAWTAGAKRRISDARRFPATAPRPASGDADQTPLGTGAG